MPDSILIDNDFPSRPAKSAHINSLPLTLPPGNHCAEVPLNFRPPEGEIYSRIESPKGELGYYLISDGSPFPFRFHVRSPSLINLSALKEMVIGQSVADAIVTLGSIDINVGEVDR